MLAAIPMLGGCWYPGYHPGGQQASRDLYTFQSRPDYPQTVTLVRPSTGEVVWQVDVPEDRFLVVRFYDTMDTGMARDRSMMRWEFMTPFDAQLGGDLNSAMPVPGVNDRRLDVTLRPAGRPMAAVPPPEPAAR
jgi:hypothetical protein